MPDNTNDEKRLPWPDESDPSKLGDHLEHGADSDQREVGSSFVSSSEASSVQLGRDFADPGSADRRKVGESFADPNSLDDKRIGKNFEETQSSAKKHHKPLKEVVHAPKNRRPLWIGIIAFVILFIVVLLVGGLPRLFRNRDNDKKADTEQDAKPIVTATKVVPASGMAGLALPGTTIPLNQAFVYARASGYLKSYKVDIGDHVKKNQLLAIIDAPDLDAQVDQAREQLHQAQQQLEMEKSQLALATVTVQRYRVLVTKGVFSRQQGDQQETTYSSAEANVAAAQRNVQAYKANLDHQIALQSYEYVRSPFDGVVTQRNVDTGALISAGSTSGASSAPAPMGQTSSAGGTSQAGQTNSGGSSGSPNTAGTSQQAPGQGGPLFAIAQNDRLRILVSVPEGYAVFAQKGLKTPVAFQEYPAMNYVGELTRTSESVDLNTRTELVEVQLDNHDGKLVPGMYAVVTFPPAAGLAPPLIIPGDAVVIRNDQSTVAVIQNGVVHLQPITIGRDLGTVVEVLTGLKQGDIIATTVSDEVTENAKVQVKMVQGGESAPQGEQKSPPPGGNTRFSNNALTDQNLQGQQQNNQQQSQGQGKGEQQKSAGSTSKP